MDKKYTFISARLPVPLYNWLAELAEEEERSISRMVALILERERRRAVSSLPPAPTLAANDE